MPVEGHRPAMQAFADIERQQQRRTDDEGGEQETHAVHRRSLAQQRRVDRIADGGCQHPQVACVELEAVRARRGRRARSASARRAARWRCRFPARSRHHIAEQDVACGDDQHRHRRLQHDDVERRRRLRGEIKSGVEEGNAERRQHEHDRPVRQASPWRRGAHAARRTAATTSAPTVQRQKASPMGGTSPATLRATMALPAQNRPVSSIRSRGSSARRPSQLAEPDWRSDASLFEAIVEAGHLLEVREHERLACGRHPHGDHIWRPARVYHPLRSMIRLANRQLLPNPRGPCEVIATYEPGIRRSRPSSSRPVPAARCIDGKDAWPDPSATFSQRSKAS